MTKKKTNNHLFRFFDKYANVNLESEPLVIIRIEKLIGGRILID